MSRRPECRPHSLNFVSDANFIQSLYDRVERARRPGTDLRRSDSFIEIIRDLCRLNEHDERHAPGEAGS